MPTEMITQASAAAVRPVATVTASGASSLAPGKGSENGSQRNEGSQAAGASREQLTAAISEIAKHVQNVQRNLNFSIDEDSGVTIIKVIDVEKDEVIRQIPSEEMLALARRLQELEGNQVSGLLVRSKA